MRHGVSFIIPTRNRPDVLKWCLHSCLAQKGIDPEILVYDDASDIPVGDAVIGEFRGRVNCLRLERNLGQPALRTRGYQEARNEIIVSLDDDTVLFDANIIFRGASRLLKSDDIGAVSLRFFELPRLINRNDLFGVRNWACDNQNDVFCSSFAGGAVILRKRAAIDCGLYPDWVYRQGEERFLAIRLLDAGYRIVLSGPPAAIHLYSPVRDHKAMNWYGIRNALLFDWICVPHPYLIPYLTKDIIRLFLYKFSLRKIPAKCGAIAWGLGSIVGKWNLRKPVSRAAFRKYLTLPRHGAIPLPADWSPEPLLKLGIINDPAELDPYLKPSGGALI